MENNNFLILDEPTNHLDIDSKEVLENALIEFDGTLLFVSHDRYFINRVAIKVLEISENGSTLYLGDYAYYVEKKAELEAMAAAQEQDGQVAVEVPVTSASHYEAQKANQKEIRKITRRIAEIEARLEVIEAEEAQLNEAMLSTNDAATLMDHQRQIDAFQEEQEALIEEWEELSMQVDE